jgi:Arc/MetJ-type ribon-helix-helix transcriptional regulator
MENPLGLRERMSDKVWHPSDILYTTTDMILLQQKGWDPTIAEVTDMVDEGTKITIRMSNADIQLMEDFMSDHDLENRSVFIRDAIREYIANNKAEAQSDDNSVTVRLNPVVLQTLENMRADGTIYDSESFIRELINTAVIPKEAIDDSRARAFKAAQQSSRIM